MRCLSERDEMYVQKQIFGFLREENMHTKRQDFGDILLGPGRRVGSSLGRSRYVT